MRTEIMHPNKAHSHPETRAELQQWIRNDLVLPPDEKRALLEAVERVFLNNERMWEQSKDDAIQAVSAAASSPWRRAR